SHGVPHGPKAWRLRADVAETVLPEEAVGHEKQAGVDDVEDVRGLLSREPRIEWDEYCAAGQCAERSRDPDRRVWCPQRYSVSRRDSVGDKRRRNGEHLVAHVDEAEADGTIDDGGSVGE